MVQMHLSACRSKAEGCWVQSLCSAETNPGEVEQGMQMLASSFREYTERREAGSCGHFPALQQIPIFVANKGRWSGMWRTTGRHLGDYPQIQPCHGHLSLTADPFGLRGWVGRKIFLLSSSLAFGSVRPETRAGQKH